MNIPGFNAPANLTPLHRLDPAVKIVSLVLLLAATFSSREAVALAGVCLSLLLVALVGRYPLGALVRLFYGLRFLLLATLLTYLFLTPGRTLPGIAWLSLDGLQEGAIVALQLFVALGWSRLLTGTSAPLDLARGIERLLSPLARLGLPVTRLTGALSLVLYFLDQLPRPAPSAEQDGTTDRRGTRLPLAERIAARTRVLGEQLERLLAQADEVAVQLAGGGRIEVGPSPSATRSIAGTGELSLMLLTLATCGLVWGVS